MKIDLPALWRSISPGQGVVLAGLVGAVAYIVVHAPDGTFAALAEKSPAELGVYIGGVALAIAGVFAKGRDAS